MKTRSRAARSLGAQRIAAMCITTASLAILPATPLVTVTSAFAQDACTPGTTKRIAFMLKQQTAFRYLNADVPFFTKTANDAGYEVLVQSAENDAQAQVSQAENVITQGVDAIVIQPVDFNVAGQIAEMAAAANIPLASYDDLILNAPHTAFIGRDPKEGGKVAAEAIVAMVPEGQLRADRRRRRPDRLDPDAGGLPPGARPAGRRAARSRS